ncbi:hypothetical protein PGT21_014894 [Puccinia graminis f. sp. tritici]|uniref:Uncharacterized protein n=1 Tax=Puccinia graminis f. sp. tritici TaxID=56615 RepID=A0A5B0PR19_PUCGR|nr:hypothetical protein PGT21_014894 [Puccinia graminis f. sp. tritici]
MCNRRPSSDHVGLTHRNRWTRRQSTVVYLYCTSSNPRDTLNDSHFHFLLAELRSQENGRWYNIILLGAQPVLSLRHSAVARNLIEISPTECIHALYRHSPTKKLPSRERLSIHHHPPSIQLKRKMNAHLLVKELVQQNKLLKETISHFPILTAGKEDEDCSPSFSGFGRDDSHSETDSADSSLSPTSSSASDHSAAIEVLLDLLDRQESRLDLLEQLGKSVLLESSNNSIPIFRGLRAGSSHSSPPSPTTSATSSSSSASVAPRNIQVDSEIDVKEWTKLVLNHLNCLKSLNSSAATNSKEVVRFIYNKLDLEPLEFLKTLLHRNRILVLKQFPAQVPPKFRFNKDLNEPAIIPDDDLLFDFPFKLYLLRYPNALLNLLNSKFSSQK